MRHGCFFMIMSIGCLCGVFADEICSIVHKNDLFSLECEQDTTAKDLKSRLKDLTEIDDLWIIQHDRVLNNHDLIDLSALVYIKEESTDIEFLDCIKKKRFLVERDYHASVTSSEKSDIRFIVLTLGYKSLPNIFMQRTQLEQAGKRIDHIHPLKFLDCIFQDEELKVGVRNIKARGGVVWNAFMDGLACSLDEESQKGSMQGYEFQDFADKLMIDPMILTQAVYNSDWNHFVTLLIQNIPRNTGMDRYDF